MELPIAECRLDLARLREQRDRYGRLGTKVEETVRERGRLTVRLRAGFDQALLREAIAVERECCPFFNFEYTPERRLLEIGVDAPEQDAALDALAFALGANTSP